MSSSAELQQRLQTVRNHYRVTPWADASDADAPLLRSWQRCHDAGMREAERVSFELVSRSLLAELDERHGELVQRARPETERLAEALRGTGCMVLLFNAQGVVIDRLGHEAAAPAVLLQATRKGVNLSERCVGTTAPAIALAECQPALVGRDAHFFSNVRQFFCVAAPLLSPGGDCLGALDITTFDSVPSFDLRSLMLDAAAAIENRLFSPPADHWLVRFHPRAELVDTPLAGLLQVAPDGQLCGANTAAARLLCTPRAGLIGQPFSALFDRRLHTVFRRSSGDRPDLVVMSTQGGLQVVARIGSGGRQGRVAGPAAALAPAPPLQAPLPGWPEAPGQGAVPAAAAEAAGPASMRELERRAIDQALQALGGNVSAAARQLGISRNTIYRRRAGLD
jgi:transcriptional regulator of acetoin/glycerol metabolism